VYLRTSSRRNKDGSTVRYLSIAHNERSPGGPSVARVLLPLGREDRLDVDALRRLVGSINRYLGEDPGTDAGAQLGAEPGGGLTITDSRPAGGVAARRAMATARDRHRPAEVLGGRRFTTDVERVLFALVANRALAPCSKLAATGWIGSDVAIDGLAAVSEDACYRAMDALLKVEDALAKRVYDSVADLLNLEVDLLFFDTTSTYFEIDEPDAPLPRDERGRVLDIDPAAAGQAAPSQDSEHDNGSKPAGFRSYGKSKDHRDDLPQVVVGMAVTRTGIPVRVWCWPNAVAFTVAGAGSLEQSRGIVSIRSVRASSSDMSLRAA
jgi:hypothetical protein